MLNEEKINELINEFQIKLINNHFELDVEYVRQLSYTQLLTIITTTFEVEFSMIIETISKESIRIIAHRIEYISRIPRSIIDPEEVWQDFCYMKLPKIIIYAIRKNLDFCRYLKVALGHYCIDVVRKVYNQKNRSTIQAESIEEQLENGIDIHQDDDFYETVYRSQTIEKLAEILDRIGNETWKKLVYHCMVFLPYVDSGGFEILKKLQKKQLLAVCDLIERQYSSSLKTNTHFMKKINQNLLDSSEDETLFIEDINLDTPEGKQKIREITKDVNNSFKRYKKEIVESIL